ncbi:precorrin-6Y C5,15-methyltransferase (decarboxylating) [Microlunatus soli]|uniref:Precorrin-6Y C5,15-methyltransferase (Decarboxylating) n=1 Tax=Microlunatus soli TaxID=630515 RepID=A0A1H1ZI00_9ACTN|nr:precorrin-6Y C5,15-methyltransferase (decarboxylating) [Microlunatus soli]
MLAEPERAVLAAAELIVGSPRLTGLLAELPSDARPTADRADLPSPLRPGMQRLLSEHAGRRVVVLASGDPLVAGVGSTLIDLFGADRVRIHPAVSSVALARARMGWSAEECQVIRIEAGTRLAAALHPGARLILLSRDRNSPRAVAEELVDAGFGPSRMTLLADLGSASEQRIDRTASDWQLADVPRLQLVCVDCAAGPVDVADTASWSRTPGLPDDAFEHDGQLSKRFQRAAALVALRPRPGELLIDLGAGAGSVAIEWCRQHPRNRVVAVEHNEERAARIRRNAARLGADRIEIRVGENGDVLGSLARPDAIFVGGGLTVQLIEYGLAVLPRHGRLVAHAVTIESEMILYEAARRHGGELTRIGVETLEPIGRLQGFKPARRVTQWAIVKG